MGAKGEKRTRLCKDKSMLETQKDRFSKFSSSQNLLISCRPSGLKRRRVSSGKDLARTLRPVQKSPSSTTMVSPRLDVDRFSNLQPSFKLDYNRLILQAMQERALDPSISNQDKQEWIKRIDEVTRLLHLEPITYKSEHSVLEVIHLGEIIVAVNQDGICWSYNICKYF